MAKKTSSLQMKIIPGLLLGFFVLLGLTLLGDLKQVSRLILEFDWRVFPLVLLLTLFNYGMRFLKWHFYLGQIGAGMISWAQSLRLFLAGFPLAITPGKVGEALKGVWINKFSGVPVGRGVAAVVAERISDGLAVMGLSTLGVITFPQYWPEFAIILAVLIIVIVLSQIRPAAQWLLGLGEKIPVIKKFSHQLREFYEGSFSLFRPKATLIGVGIGVISWFGEGIGFYLILTTLGLPEGWNTLSMAVFVLSFSTVLGAASALPGGLGAVDASIAGMLTFLMGVEAPVATAATLLIRLATLWFGISLGLFTWTFSADLLGMKGENEAAIES
ncbi:MAG: YbhN family protein [Anaerolineaceae bacterium]